MTAYWDVAPLKFTDVSEALPAYITRAMGNFYQTTRRNIPEDSHLSTRRRENLKSHIYLFVYQFLHYYFYFHSSLLVMFHPIPSFFYLGSQ
jgi:hypothetical protein